jgi:hypothetical protein
VSDEKRTPGECWREIMRFWSFAPKGRTKAELRGTPKHVQKIRDKQHEDAEKAWKVRVSDSILAEAVLAEARKVWGQLEHGAIPPYLDGLIRSVVPDDAALAEPAKKPVSEKAEPVAQASPDVARVETRPLSRVMQAFREVWPEWPQSPKYFEAEETGASAWRSVVTDENVDDVVTSCRHYIACVASGEVEIPHTLKWFLTKGLKGEEEAWWQHFLVRARAAADPVASAGFDAAYAAYPDFTDKAGARSGSAEVYHRLIPAELRLDHLLAVQAFARKRAGEDPEYTTKFSGFCRSWQRQLAKLELEFDEVGSAVLRVLDSVGSPMPVEYIECSWAEGAIAHFVDRGMALRQAVEAALTKLQAGKVVSGVDVAAAAAQVVESAHISACKRIGFVIQSTLDAPRPRVSDAPPPAGGMAG